MSELEFECEFMKPFQLKSENFIRHNKCVSLDGLRGCIDFDKDGKQIKICESLKLKEKSVERFCCESENDKLLKKYDGKD